ncbi:MAG: hypothetical protein HYZ26_14440 [Chloroflexi bacterium]|nr:hypothetical protein [Chloroflexota bacterium]
MKAFLTKLTIFTLPLAALVAGVNYRADPASLFRHDYERAMAARLLAGEALGVNRNYDDRLLVRLLAEGRDAPPALVVLGSSASLELTADDFCAGTAGFWNVSVSGAGLNDYLALVEVLRVNEQWPQRIVLEITPRLLQANPNEVRWQTLRGEYAAMVAALYPESPQPAAGAWLPPGLGELFSPAYFQESLAALISRRGEDADPFRIGERKAVKLPQGAQVYPPALVPDAAGVQALVNSYLVEYPSWPAPDPGRQETLRRLVDYLAGQGVEVSIYFPPFHPAVYAAWGGDRIAVQAYEAFVAELAAAGGASLLGRHDPAPFGLTAADFRDGVHLLKPSLDEFFTPLGCGWTGG